jgi:hypothetical protein
MVVHLASLVSLSYTSWSRLEVELGIMLRPCKYARCLTSSAFIIAFESHLIIRSIAIEGKSRMYRQPPELLRTWSAMKKVSFQRMTLHHPSSNPHGYGRNVFVPSTTSYLTTVTSGLFRRPHCSTSPRKSILYCTILRTPYTLLCGVRQGCDGVEPLRSTVVADLSDHIIGYLLTVEMGCVPFPLHMWI